MIYFDHAATTPLYDDVKTLLLESFEHDFANPSSKHKLGSQAAKKIDGARKSILKLLNASQYELIFTSSATESNNQVIKTFCEDSDVLYFLSDHPSISKCLENRGEYLLESDDLLERVGQETKLVVLSLVNSQAGLVKDVEELSAKIKEKNPETKVLVDAVQGLGKVAFDLQKSHIDYISIAAHKIGGPRGIAGLIYKKDAPLKTLLCGGGHEFDLRSSTPATSLILGFAKAVEISMTHLEENYKRISELQNLLVRNLKSLHINISFPFEENNISPYITCLMFQGVPSDVLLRHLEMKEVYISSTTACSSKIKGKNPMFVGLGIDEKFHKNIMRISFSSQTTQEEVDEFIKRLGQVIQEISFLIK